MLLSIALLCCYYALFSIFLFFFFKQKTAYEMRISDWSSDVCSSDLFKENMKRQPVQSMWVFTVEVGTAIRSGDKDKMKGWGDLNGKRIFTGPRPWEIGRASCRERVCQYV